MKHPVTTRALIRFGFERSLQNCSLAHRLFLLSITVITLLLITPSASNAQTVVYSWNATTYYQTHNIPPWNLTWVSGSSGPLRCSCTNSNNLYYTLVAPSLSLQTGSCYYATITFAVHTPTIPASYFYIYSRNTSGKYTGNQYDTWQTWVGDSGTTTRTITLPLDLSTNVTGTGQWSISMGLEGPGSWDMSSYFIYAGPYYTTTTPVLDGTAATTTTGIPVATGFNAFTITPPGSSGTGAPVTLGTNSFIPNSPTSGTANAAALNNAIALCHSSSSNLLTITTTGTYWLSGTAGINMSGTDLTINGNGSVFVFSQITNSAVAISLTNSKRMVIENLTFDWDWTVEPIASLGTVTNLVTGTASTQCDFVFNNLNSTQVALVKTTPWSSLFAMDPTLFVRTTNNGIYSIPGGTTITTGSAGSNSLHASFPAVVPIVSGSSYCIRHMYYNMDLFKMFSSNNILFNNVNIYSFPGMGWLCEGDSHHWALENCNIQRAPGSTNPLTTAADGVHSNEGQGNIIIQNCTFCGEGDDSINIHDGCYQTSAAISATNANMLTLTGYTKVVNNPRLNVGDILSFYSPDYSYLNGSSTPVLSGSITSLSTSGSNEIIKFSSAVPTPLSQYAILRNTRYNTSNVHIANCDFINTNGDAILLSASGATVENCLFQNVCTSAVELEANLAPGLWCEGNGATNVLVQNNEFINVSGIMAGKFAGAVIAACPRNSAGASLPWGPTYAPLYNTLTIQNNTFENCSGPAMNLTSCTNVIANLNQIDNVQSMPYSTRYAGTILTQYSSNLALGGNTWINEIASSATYGIVSDTNTTTNVVTGTNALVNFSANVTETFESYTSGTSFTSGTSLGSATNGWAYAWKTAASYGTPKGVIANANPVDSGQYLSGTITTQAGHTAASGAITRPFTATSVNAPFDIYFCIRPDSTPSNVSYLLGDNQNISAFGPDSTSSWQIASVNGTWQFYDGGANGGSNSYYDTGIPVVAGTVYDVSVTVNPNAHTWQGTLSNGITFYTRSALNARSSTFDLDQTLAVGGRWLTWGVKEIVTSGTTVGTTGAFSVDSISVQY